MPVLPTDEDLGFWLLSDGIGGDASPNCLNWLCDAVASKLATYLTVCVIMALLAAAKVPDLATRLADL